MNEQDPIARRARELFERAGRPSDPATGLRLRESRRLALSGAPRRFATLLPVAASAALLALGLAWWLPRQPAQPATSAANAAIEPAAIGSDEDSELYSWLSDAPVAPDDDKGGAL